MHSRRPQKVRYERVKVPTGPSARQFVHLDSAIMAKDELLQSRTSATRREAERYLERWRRKHEDKLTIAHTGSLASQATEVIARHLVLDIKSGMQCWHSYINTHGLIPASIALDILNRVEKYCLSGPSLQDWEREATGRLPFELWAAIMVQGPGTVGRMATYRGLVLSDQAELDYLAASNAELQAPCFLVSLDLSRSSFNDSDATTLKLSVGLTLAALRLDATSITTLGIANLARSLGDSCGSFLRLQYLSLCGLSKVGDAALAHVAKFPSLAALDIRGTDTSGLHFLRKKLADLSASHFHIAADQERQVFASNLSLSTALRRLSTMLQPSDGPISSVIVSIREVERAQTFERWTEPEVTGGVHTLCLGQIFGTAPLARDLIANDSEQAREGHAAFRLGSGGAALSLSASDDLGSRCIRKVREETSDTEEPSIPSATGAKVRYTAKQPDIRSVVPPRDAQLLFRKIWHAGAVLVLKDVKPDLTLHGTTVAKHQQVRAMRPSLEPVAARRTVSSEISLDSLLKPARETPGAARLPSSSSTSSLPRAMSLPVSSGLSAKRTWENEPTTNTAAPGSKAARLGLSAFRKRNFS